MPLTELSPQEAASHATKVFWDVRLHNAPSPPSFVSHVRNKIAREAQSRKCRLNGPASSYTSPPLPSPYVREAAGMPAFALSYSSLSDRVRQVLESKKPAKSPGRSKAEKQPVTSTSTSDPKEDQIKVLKAQLSEAKKRTAPEASKSSKRSLPDLSPTTANEY